MAVLLAVGCLWRLEWQRERICIAVGMSSTTVLLLLCALAMAHTSLAAQLAASADSDSASISGHTPFGGPAPGGTSVTVIGDRVGEGTSCAFGNHAVPATRVNDSAVTCTAPALQLADARQDVCLLVQLAGENTTCATYTYYRTLVRAGCRPVPAAHAYARRTSCDCPFFPLGDACLQHRGHAGSLVRKGFHEHARGAWGKRHPLRGRR